MKLMYNILCQDISRQCTFYENLLFLKEIKEYGNEIYKVLDAGSFQIGFNAVKAYDLLELQDRKQDLDSRPRPVFGLPTIIFGTAHDVDGVAKRVVNLGGTVVKDPFVTYYGQYQALFADTEDNVIRVAAPSPNS